MNLYISTRGDEPRSPSSPWSARSFPSQVRRVRRYSRNLKRKLSSKTYPGKTTWQHHIILKQNIENLQSNLSKAPVLKTSSLQWIPPPTRSRGVAAPVVKIIHHDSVAKSYYDINHIFGKTCVGFLQTMWIWFWLLMWTVNNILVTVVSLCEIGPRCNHDVP